MKDIKELRAGAHVEIAGHRYRLAAIDSLNNEVGIELYVMDEAGRKYPKGYKVNDIEPIPITSELLQELGLAKSCGDVVAFIDTKSAKVMAEKNGENVIPTIEVWQDEYTRPYWIVAVMCSNGDIPLPHGRIAVRYLHELEAFVHLTTKTELIKD